MSYPYIKTTIETDIPTLITNGDWDPVTSPPLAERIAPGFGNSRLITLKSHRENSLRKRSLIGFMLIGLSAVVLSITFMVWGITPR
jgi:hypothetical protein